MAETTSPMSIEELNSALLAAYKTQQAQKTQAGAKASTTQTGDVSFDSVLSQIQTVPVTTPTGQSPLAPTTHQPVVDMGNRAALGSTALVAQEVSQNTQSSNEPKKIYNFTARKNLEETKSYDIETSSSTQQQRSTTAQTTPLEEKKSYEGSYEDSDLSFADFIDLINPLQHIPLINTAYRALTGDEIKPEIQVAGSFLFGLATGSVLLSGAAGIASAMIEQQTGEEPTIQLANAVLGLDEENEPTIQMPNPSSEAKVVLADNEAAASAITSHSKSATTSTTTSQLTTAQEQKLAQVKAELMQSLQQDVGQMKDLPMGAQKSALAGLAGGVSPAQAYQQLGTKLARAEKKTTPLQNAKHYDNVALKNVSAQKQAQTTTLNNEMESEAAAIQSGKDPFLFETLMGQALDKYAAIQKTENSYR